MNRFLKARYWEVVRTCLVEFYSFSGRSAAQKVREYRRHIASDADDEADREWDDLVYHEEALNLAKRLAGVTRADGPDEWSRYLRLLESIKLPTEPKKVRDGFVDRVHVGQHQVAALRLR